MDNVFDGCTEILLNQIIESSPNGCPEAENLIQQLSEFQNVCLNMGLCPKGELIRSFMCRHFLRDAMQRMAKVLSSVNEDEAIGSIMERTRQFIESVGEETEAERAYVVVRNLIIIAENIVKQTKKQLLPTVSKQPVRCILALSNSVARLSFFTGFPSFPLLFDRSSKLGRPSLP